MVAVSDITLCNLLAGAIHQLYLHAVLDFLHAHALVAGYADAVSNLLDECLILASFGLKHRLADCRLDFFLIIADDSAVAFYNYLNHRE